MSLQTIVERQHGVGHVVSHELVLSRCMFRLAMVRIAISGTAAARVVR